jgi:outer membrane protein TolC
MRTTISPGVGVDARVRRSLAKKTLAAGVLIGCIASGPQLRGSSERPAVSGPGKIARMFHATDAQLGGFIADLLETNPEVRSARARSESRREQVPQHKSLPDPTLTYRYFGEGPETRVGPQRHGLEISQGVPWFGKRQLQAQRAGHEAAGVAWRARELERALVAELKQSYFEAAYLQEALAVNAEESRLLQRFERIALTRYSTGEGIQQSVIRVQTEISRLADREAALRQRLDAATRRIARLTGRPDAATRLQPIRLGLPDLDYDPEALERESLQDHPSVRAVEEAVRADEAWLRRRRLDARPDFRFGVGYVNVDDRDDTAGVLVPPEDNGQDIWALTVGINVPVFRKRLRAGEAEAHQRVRSTEYQLENARDRLRYTVQESLLRLQSVRGRARLHSDVIVPQAEQSLASAEAAYATNRQSFLDLLDAERVLFQARLTYHRLLADHWIALADIEYGLGRSFPAEGNEL